MPNRPGFLPSGGNYRELISYRKSEIIYDFTFRFCEKFLRERMTRARLDHRNRPRG